MKVKISKIALLSVEPLTL